MKTPKTQPSATPVRTPSFSYVSVTLPSKGVLYGPEAVIATPVIPDGAVEVRKMTINEDEILASSGGTALTRLSKVLQRCSRLPEGFDPENLLVVDRMFLLIAIRTTTFGSRYHVQFKCPNCGTANKADVDIVRDLEETSIADDMLEPFEVVLPDAGVRVGLRLQRGFDEHDAVRSAKTTAARGNDPTPVRDQLRQVIVSIDGDPVTNPLVKLDLINRLTSMDLLAVREAMTSKDFGIDLTIHPECSRCAAESEMEMPFSTEFFRPTRR